VLFDLGSHLVDQALVLFGDPDAVTADVRSERDAAAADDAFDVMLQYPRMRALLRATMLAAEPGPRFVLRGTDATFVKHGVDPQEERLGRGDDPAVGNWAEEPPERWGTLTRATDHGPVGESIRTAAGDYKRYYENVRDAIRGDAPLVVTPRQALNVIRILEIAQESSRTGRTIEVPQA
jgi:predicted dehydrogenase